MLDILNSMEMRMNLRGYSPKTVEAYLRYVLKLANFYQKSFEQLETEEIQKYLHHLIVNKDFSNSYIHANYSAIKFLYERILKKNWNRELLPRLKKEKKLPVMLAKSEIKKIFSAVTNVKHKAIFMTIYSSGLRISEVCTLKIKDIDSKNMQIRVRQGKGKRDRYTILSETNLKILREYWKKYRPKSWLFPGQPSDTSLGPRAVQIAFKNTLEKANITKAATVHTLRHCFATHLLEAGNDLLYIQKLLGHTSPKTTAIYIHLTRKDINNVKSPLDIMMDDDSND